MNAEYLNFQDEPHQPGEGGPHLNQGEESKFSIEDVARRIREQEALDHATALALAA